MNKLPLKKPRFDIYAFSFLMILASLILVITNVFNRPTDDLVVNVYYEFNVVGTHELNSDQSFVYEKEDYKISILYPDGWTYKDGESDRGLEVNIIPRLEDIDKSVEIKILVLKESYSPSEKDYSDFSKDLLREVFDDDDGADIKNGESEEEISGVTGKRINYSYTKEDDSGWDVDFIFIEENDTLYLIIKISDVYYRGFTDSLFETMLGSISFD